MADTNFSTGTIIASTWLDDVNTNTYTILSAVAGTNTLTGNAASTVTVGYPRGVAFRFLPVNNNTGAVTINISGLGAKALTKFGADPLVANDLRQGMWAYIAYDGTQFQLINPRTTDFLFPSGIAPITAGGNGIAVIQPVGNCRLVKSGANLVLQPYQGNILAFNAGYATIPAAGVSLAPTALAINTNFFIYATQAAGVVTALEASTTGHSTDATTGIEVKTGDATRALVGQARTIAGPAWQDTAAQRFVISWFNRRPINGLAFYTAARSTASLTYAEPSTEIRVEFLAWGTDAVHATLSGAVSNNLNAAAINTAIGLDSTTVPLDGFSQAGNQSTTNTITMPHSQSTIFTPTEGNHFVTLLGRSVGGGTSSWTGSASVAERAAMQTLLQG